MVSSKCCLCGDSGLRVYVLGYVTEIQDGSTSLAHLVWTNHGLSGMTERVLANRHSWSFIVFSLVNTKILSLSGDFLF